MLVAVRTVFVLCLRRWWCGGGVGAPCTTVQVPVLFTSRRPCRCQPLWDVRRPVAQRQGPRCSPLTFCRRNHLGNHESKTKKKTTCYQQLLCTKYCQLYATSTRTPTTATTVGCAAPSHRDSRYILHLNATSTQPALPTSCEYTTTPNYTCPRQPAGLCSQQGAYCAFLHLQPGAVK